MNISLRLFIFNLLGGFRFYHVFFSISMSREIDENFISINLNWVSLFSGFCWVEFSHEMWGAWIFMKCSWCSLWQWTMWYLFYFKETWLLFTHGVLLNMGKWIFGKGLSKVLSFEHEIETNEIQRPNIEYWKTDIPNFDSFLVWWHFTSL